MKTILLAAAVAATTMTACNSSISGNAQQSENSDSGMHGHGAHASMPAGTGNDMQRIMDDMMKEMHAAKPSGNPDRDFAAMMIAHHQGAIDMAQVELSSGTNAEMRKLAEGIVAAQEKEIAEMQRIMAALPEGDVNANAAAYDALMGSMSGMMSSHPSPTGNTDIDFVQAMIPHHEGAVAMAKVELQHGRDEKLKAMAQQMVDDQTREIAEMKAWIEMQP